MGKIIILIIVSAQLLIAQNPVEMINDHCKSKYGQQFKELIYVSIKNQKLYHISDNTINDEYTISSAKKGIGNIRNSDKTPIGLHYIKEKYGQKTPINGRMIARKFEGLIATIYQDTSSSKTDDITSRILWLAGLEEGINKGGNVDSYQRYIYIHGTSEEGKLGTPASHGCIRMSNLDVINLFDKVKEGTKVLILDK
jgi:lipoprotein-anchoring transpeptidase ErfK/SrfK|tara:strand:- start:3370 stop:3960 length:591 start_codon:yes stop_codon:yes gene_type:complete